MGAQSPIEAVQTLGRYTLLEKIGEGYLGSVYRGFDQNLGQAVAVRVLCEGIKWDAGIEEIYTKQCQSVSRLKHEGIASVLEFGKEGPFQYIVMESLGNSSLKSLIAQKPAMTVEAKLSIMIQVVEALSHAHKNGILHRDLGPAKIHLTADGKPKIRDFAIASVLMKHLPHPWIRFGSPIYLSPEQIQQLSCDHRSDIFSAGIIFYEMLTYLHPFYDRDSNKTLDNILQGVQLPTFDRFPDEPPAIWPILKTCLEKDPNNRYQSMDDLANGLKDLLKDLAEDTRLMLSELYAAHTSLRKAAAKPDAPESAVALLQDIQKLVNGEKEADYASLDRLMTLLIEQYPTVQAATGSLPSVETAFQEFAPEGTGGKIDGKSETSEAETSPETQNPSPIELALTTVLASNSPDLAAVPADKAPEAASENTEKEESNKDTDALFSEMWGLSSEMQFALETSFVKPEEENLFDPDMDQAAIPIAAMAPDSTAPQLPMEAAAGISTAPDNPLMQENRIEQPEIRCIDSTVSVAAPQSVQEIPIAKPEEEEKTEAISNKYAEAPVIQTVADPIADQQQDAPKKAGLATCYRRIRRPSYRTTVVLLSLLLMAAAAYIVWGTDFAQSVSESVKSRILNSSIAADAFARLRNLKSSNVASASNQQKPGAMAVQPTAVPVVEVSSPDPSVEQKGTTDAPPRELVSRISRLITSGKLELARAEIDRLQRDYPLAPQGAQLRRQWDAKNSAEMQERKRKEDEQLSATRQQKEDAWNRDLGALLARGQYAEANSAVNRWLAEDPGSVKARENSLKIAEIQRNLSIYASALAESRYPEALAALNSAERLNPSDTKFADLRRQLETRRAAAKASLTVYRLGPKAILSLDGRPIGSDGEIENESIPIGNHTLAIESGGSVITSRRQEYLENQHIALVYDLAKQNLRPMADADRELISKRKAMEEVRYFDAEHEHGAFRGSCRGLLMIDYLDVAYRPTSGDHGFRMPFKVLKLRVKGRIIELINISDNKRFQSFKLHDEQAAEKFKRSWDELKAMTQQ
ncbi:MAG: protein kinase [Acidobacteria bacterium]|nr:protein kinase [Acidobacteriota bacterium]